MLKLFSKFIIPKQLVIQYTDKCNAQCPQCGMNVKESYPRSTLNPDDVKRIIDTAVKKGVKILQITGGEPFLFFDEIASLIKYAGNAGIKYILTGTNGFMFMNHDSPDFTKRVTNIVEKLAETRIYSFWISIDSSVTDVHEKMRGLPGVIAGIKKVLPIFHKHGIYPAAILAINRNMNGFWDQMDLKSMEFYEYFQKAFRDYFNFLLNTGFTTSITAYPMSAYNAYENVEPVYMAISRENLVTFSNEEKAVLLKAFFDVIPEFRQKIRIFNPMSSLYSLIRQYTDKEWLCYPCRGGSEYFFVDAKDGNTYPCGFMRQENLGKFWELDFENNNQKPSCVTCDWACFRDPSELVGPIEEIFTRPLAFINRVVKDKQFIRVWLKDILYYWACGYFNGRIPPNYKKLSIFTRR